MFTQIGPVVHVALAQEAGTASICERLLIRRTGLYTLDMTTADGDAQRRDWLTYAPRSGDADVFRGPRRIPIRPGWAIASLLLFAAAAALFSEELATSVVPTRSVIWGSLALAAYITGLLCLLGARQANLGLATWKFGAWILLWYGLTFGLATVMWSKPQPSPSDQIAVSSVLRALWLLAVGMTAWVIGYLAGPGQPLRRVAGRGMAVVGGRRLGIVRSLLTPWLLYLIGVAARIASSATTGQFGYVGDPASALSSATGYGQILSDLSLLCPLAISAAALQVYRERLSSARITLAVLFVVECAFGAAAGGKQSFVIAILAAVIPMSAARYRLPKLAVIIGILIFLVIVIPFNQAYRTAVRGGPATLSTSQAIDVAPTILRQTLTSQSLLTVIPSSVTYLLQRVQEIEGPAIILQRTPGQIPFNSPAQLMKAPVVDMIPRAIWPGKPILSPGYEFGEQYFGIPSTNYTAVAISPIGDLYRYGGWVPVIAGMFIFGCGIRLLDDVFDIRANPHAIFLIVLFFPVLVKGEDDWVGILAGIPATIVIWLLAVALTFRPRRSP
jgi:hypothetical protein